MNKVWHYTVWAYLPEIVKWGELFPSNAGAPGEKPALWFSAHQCWEPTATKAAISRAGKLIHLSLDEQLQHGGGIRFGLRRDDTRLLDWRAACKAIGTPARMRTALERTGRKQGGNPAHWFATTAAIPLSQLQLQVWRDGWNDAVANEAVGEWEGR